MLLRFSVLLFFPVWAGSCDSAIAMWLRFYVLLFVLLFQFGQVHIIKTNTLPSCNSAITMQLRFHVLLFLLLLFQFGHVHIIETSSQII